jgi:16S rRNA G1207 methylase RsmC
LLDLGCGWGPLALSMAIASPAAQVWAVDVNPRALDLVRRSATDAGVRSIVAATPDEVPETVRFDAIWSNPPIRIGKQALNALLMRWLPRLADGACGYLVVQRNLGADSLITWLGGALPDFAVAKIASAKGYRVIEVRRPGG